MLLSQMGYYNPVPAHLNPESILYDIFICTLKKSLDANQQNQF